MSFYPSSSLLTITVKPSLHESAFNETYGFRAKREVSREFAGQIRAFLRKNSQNELKSSEEKEE